MPHPADVFAGQQLRFFRKLRGLSQTQLADGIGVRFQQVQKYEIAANRISVSRLHDICDFLEITPSDFFETSANPNIEGAPNDEEAALIAAFRKADPNVRRAILSLANSVSRADA
jgi:transcriptional regulator with XRE-family HTH domain